jgi:hypothetical protein
MDPVKDLAHIIRHSCFIEKVETCMVSAEFGPRPTLRICLD